MDTEVSYDHERDRHREQQAHALAEILGQRDADVAGTADKDYNLIWFTEKCLNNALRLETYVQDAERQGDSELVEFFRKAQADSRKGAEVGKQMLRKRLSA